MKAVQIKEYGNLEVLQYVDVDEPTLTNNSILIKVEASGVNFADTYTRRGKFPTQASLPLTLGIEGCGIVTAVSEDQDKSLLGTRVVFYQRGGAYAEKILIKSG